MRIPVSGGSRWKLAALEDVHAIVGFDRRSAFGFEYSGMVQSECSLLQRYLDVRDLLG